MANHDPWTCSTCGEELTQGYHDCPLKKPVDLVEQKRFLDSLKGKEEDNIGEAS